MTRLSLNVVVLCMLACTVLGDMYLQSPPGCNDRLNEQGDRQNANRLFDSENNARGGYCWSPGSSMKYYEGSILPIQWTAQHGCGGEHVTCTEVIQYMCDPEMRDGTETTTIPDDVTQYNAQTNGVYRYGMYENFQYYEDAKIRQRNKGLFIADQKPQGRAINTRQSPGNTRYGFEIAEERDYYPYWHPAPWKDIVVLTDRLEHCPFYQAESQNVKAKNYCSGVAEGTDGVPNNQGACLTAGGKWEEEPSHNLPAPECLLADFSRDNHLGNTLDGQMANYTWIVPSAKQESCITLGNCNCAIRIRYNITTNESAGLYDTFLDSRNNSIIKNNPTVDVEGGELTLALNTAQYGRTFQDRSYIFHILPRPSGVSSDTKIYNLNVRGKRGNIVQVYPAVEYDFVPNRLSVEQEDFVHFQWTGCDNNPANNQGEGKVQTDRSNIIQIQDLNNNVPVIATNNSVEGLLFESEYLRTRMALIDQDPSKCVDVATLIQQNGNDVSQLITNCAKLNGVNRAGVSTPYFDGGLVRMNSTGKYTYMSSRNNNFSNRTQKGQLTVSEKKKKKISAGAVVGIVFGSVAVVAAALGGLVFYGKKNPMSPVGRVVDNINIPYMLTKTKTDTYGRKEGLLNNDHGSSR